MDSFLSMIIARLRNVLGFVKFKCHQMMTTTRESARDVILIFVCLCNRSLILYIFFRINNLTFETRKTILPKQVVVILRGERSTKTSSSH